MALPNIINEINTIKSSYLPLSGGTMSGGLISSSNIAYQTNNSSHCDYGYNYADRNGALLALRSSGYTNNPGGFEVIARNETASVSLDGKIDGTLLWGKKSVECMDSLYKSNTNKSYSWIRYKNGLQIVWGRHNHTGTTTQINFPVAFVNAYYGIQLCTDWTGDAISAINTVCWVGSINTTYFKIYRNYTSELYWNFTAIGYWK